MPLISRNGSLGRLQVKTPVALTGQRIGLLGGSFNPPHAGHVQITEIALRRLQLDQVWWVVTPGNPLKSNGQLPPLRSRMVSCRQLMSRRNVIITGFEAELGTAYTAATVAFLTKRHAGVHFVWIMGGDNLAGFHHWQRWRAIAASVTIAVVDRPGWHLAAMASPAARAMARAFVPEHKAGYLPQLKAPAWTLLTGPLSQLSSTKLRAAGA